MPGRELRVRSGAVTLAGEEAGEGAAVVLLHGLTATRRYVVMGSRLLERAGFRVISYDARGHGGSAPAGARDEYAYEHLVGDLAAMLDTVGVARAILVGASMGAHTALAYALRTPQRVRALCLITPAFDPAAARSGDSFAGWDALARGLREGGVEGFVRAYDFDGVDERWRATIVRVLRQRLGAHVHPHAVADALEVTPRSRPLEQLAQLAQLRVPALIVGTRDEADPGHPLAVAERYAAAIPRGRMAVEETGASPLAWQGGALSRLVIELARTAAP